MAERLKATALQRSLLSPLACSRVRAAPLFPALLCSALPASAGLRRREGVRERAHVASVQQAGGKKVSCLTCASAAACLPPRCADPAPLCLLPCLASASAALSPLLLLLAPLMDRGQHLQARLGAGAPATHQQH